MWRRTLLSFGIPLESRGCHCRAPGTRLSPEIPGISFHGLDQGNTRNEPLGYSFSRLRK